MTTLRLLPELEEALRQVPGIRAVSVVTGPDSVPTEIHIVASRSKGAKQVVRDVQSLALAAHGIAANPLLVRVADFTIAGGYRATLQLLGDPRVSPTAVFAASDEMAMGAIMAARDLGKKVPDRHTCVVKSKPVGSSGMR